MFVHPNKGIVIIMQQPYQNSQLSLPPSSLAGKTCGISRQTPFLYHLYLEQWYLRKESSACEPVPNKIPHDGRSLEAHAAADSEYPWWPVHAVAVDGDAGGDMFTPDTLWVEKRHGCSSLLWCFFSPYLVFVRSKIW